MPLWSAGSARDGDERPFGPLPLGLLALALALLITAVLIGMRYNRNLPRQRSS